MKTNSTTKIKNVLTIGFCFGVCLAASFTTAIQSKADCEDMYGKVRKKNTTKLAVSIPLVALGSAASTVVGAGAYEGGILLASTLAAGGATDTANVLAYTGLGLGISSTAGGGVFGVTQGIKLSKISAVHAIKIKHLIQDSKIVEKGLDKSESVDTLDELTEKLSKEKNVSLKREEVARVILDANNSNLFCPAEDRVFRYKDIKEYVNGKL